MSGELSDRQAFIEMLNAQGFEQIVTVDRKPNGFLDIHTHPFEAKAFILEGEIGLRLGDAEQVYRAGQVFHLGANEPHAEWYGPEGVRYLVGRK